MPSASWYQEVHERLLAEHPTAPAELAEIAVGPLTRALERKYPRLKDPTLVADAVTDSLIDYFKNPGKFDSSKRGLYGYLLMAAEGDLKNALAKRNRRQAEVAEDIEVEVAAAGGKVMVEARDVVAELYTERVRQEINELFHDPKDREMVELIFEGERATEAFVAVLGIETWTTAEQRSEVKRHKDRLKKRLREYGHQIRENR
ncbi:MAG: hypothetical protein WAM82_15455 [Thermoanaerobaculia bacterium]